MFTVALVNNVYFSQTVLNQSTFDLGVNSFLGKGGISAQDGGSLVLNATGSGIVGDKTEDSYGSNDFWLVKYDANNSIEWDKTIGGDANDIVESAIQKSDGNYLVVGTSSSVVSGVKNSANNGGSDIWVMELSPTGNIIWEKSYGGLDNEFARDVIVTTTNIWVLGFTFSDVSGDRIKPYYGQGDVWLLKLDLNGDLIEEFTYGGDDYEEASGLVYNPVLDNIFLLASSESDVSGNKTAVSYGSEDIWILKIDTHGNVLDDNSFGGLNSEFLSTKPLIYNDKIYFSCSSSSGISGNKSEAGFGSSDIWTVCLDLSLQKIAEKVVGGDLGDFPTTITTIGSQISVAGICYSQNTGNVTATTNGQGDVFIIGMDSDNLNLIFQDMVGGNLLEFVMDIFPKNSGGIRVLSRTTSDLSGDMQINNPTGATKFWMFDYQGTLSINDEVNDNENNMLRLFPNPVSSGNYVFTKSKNETLKLFDANGVLVKEGYKTDRINTEKLASGLYFVTNGLKQVKLIVTN